MISVLMFLVIDITGIIIIVIASILALSLIGVFINNRKYKRRYLRYYRQLDKTINKKFNGNMLVEDLINKYTVDNTNTYKSLKSKGKRITKKYLDYYVNKLPELVLLKSFTSADKNRSELVIYVLDENDRILFKWEKDKKVKGLIKAINKYQMLTPMIAYLYELPLSINEDNPYRLTNHENDNLLAYDIVKNSKKMQKRYKERKPKDKKKKKKKK